MYVDSSRTKHETWYTNKNHPQNQQQQNQNIQTKANQTSSKIVTYINTCQTQSTPCDQRCETEDEEPQS